MEPVSLYRPRVSRETRRLLVAGAVAIAVLWLLARIRFDDRPAINPVPSVLGQLNTGARFDALASEIDILQDRLIPQLLAVDTAPATISESADARPRAAALRWREGLAIALLPSDTGVPAPAGSDVRAFDPATALAVVRVSDARPPIPLVPWMPRRAQQPRYLIASDVTPVGVSLRPAFAGALAPIEGTVWPGTVWAMPSGTAIAPGSFLFTTTGEFIGLAVPHAGGLAVVPGDTVLAEAERLLAAESRSPGTIGVEVQALTKPIAEVTGAQTGVVVTSTARDGAAEDALSPGDVIEAVNGRPLATRQEWVALVARLAAGETLALRVRTRGNVREVSIQARAIDAGATAGAGAALGLTMRRREGIGAEVTRLQPASVAHRAGLAVGDVITRFGDVAAPAPAQVTRAFTALDAGERLMVAVTRGDAHFVTVVGR